jgi:hypothetical protein
MGSNVSNETNTANSFPEIINGYQKIKIQELETQINSENKYCSDYTDTLKFSACTSTHKYDKKCCCETLYTESNGKKLTRLTSNGFYCAFLYAYNNHGDVKITPDDVWITIVLYFKEYVNTNAEKLRTKFVSHEGKKELTVTAGKETNESQWDDFFAKIIEAIKENTSEGVVDKLKSDFSTTTRFEEIISTSAIMDTFKEYFSFGRFIPMCGIQNIWMKGTLEDWIKIKTKLTGLKEFDVDKKLSKYVDELIPIINNFIDTYQNKVDVDFWNRIMNFERGRLGSGSTTYTSGWILKFFGIYDKIEGEPEIKQIKVDIKIDNRLTSTIKNVKLVAGFVGVIEEQTEDRMIYSPQLAISIIEPKCK